MGWGAAGGSLGVASVQSQKKKDIPEPPPPRVGVHSGGSGGRSNPPRCAAPVTSRQPSGDPLGHRKEHRNRTQNRRAVIRRQLTGKTCPLVRLLFRCLGGKYG